MAAPPTVDILGPAQALAALLAPAGTPVGTIGAVMAATPDPPYQGALPLVMIRPVPVRGQITREGATSFRVDGTLDLWYLDAVASAQGRSLAAIEGDAGANLATIIQIILQNRTLSGSVISLVPPLTYLGDESGPYVELAGTMWFYMALRLPFIGAGGQILCF